MACAAQGCTLHHLTKSRFQSEALGLLTENHNDHALVSLKQRLKLAGTVHSELGHRGQCATRVVHFAVVWCPAGAVAASVSTWAFAFYIQPIMMPYYSEMPPGNVGMHATGIAVNGVLCCTALIPYVLIAFFGAALWGPAAAETGNVLENDIYGLFGPNGEVPCPNKIQGALNICVTVYLAITIPPIEFALTHIVNTWVSEIRRRFKLQKWIPKRGQVRLCSAREIGLRAGSQLACGLCTPCGLQQQG